MDLREPASDLEAPRPALSVPLRAARLVHTAAIRPCDHSSNRLSALRRVHGHPHRPRAGDPGCLVLLPAIYAGSSDCRGRGHRADAGEVAAPMDGADLSHRLRAIAGVPALHGRLHGRTWRPGGLEETCPHRRAGCRLGHSPPARAERDRNSRSYSTMTQLTGVEAGSAAARRDAQLDLLRFVALVGVIIYQWFGWRWTPIVIPFAALTFTIAGTLVAASLDRSAAYPWTVLAKRARRVLLPVWGLAAVAVPLMVWYGAAAGAGPGIGSAPGWRSMLLWVVPLFEPPSSAWGTAWTGSLWFVPAYLWLTLISPPLLWCFRKWPLRTAALPALGLAGALSGIWSPSSGLGEVLLTLTLFGGYWLIGFAYHDNRIQTMSWTLLIIVALILMGAGLLGTLRAADVTAAHLAGLPVANSLWGAGVVILLLRLGGRLSSRPRSTWVRTALAAIQARALTIFLWSFPAFLSSAAVLTRYDWSPRTNAEAVIEQTGVALALIMVPVLLLGWLEDLVIGRSPRLNPFATRSDQPRSDRPRRRALVAWPAMVAGVTAAIVVTALVFPADSAPLISRARTAVPAAPQPDSGGNGTDRRLPRRVVAGYWQSWGGPS